MIANFFIFGIAAFAFYVEASTVSWDLSIFSAAIILWNLVPYFMALVLNYEETKYVLFKCSFIILMPLFSVLIHFLWHFDIGGTQTNSSTAGIFFLFLPFYSAGIGAGVGFVLEFTKSLIEKGTGEQQE